MSLTKECQNYFNFFSDKNLNELKKMFSHNITLKDWENDKQGIDEVLITIENIFKSVNKIKVEIIKIYEFKNDCLCLISINIDNQKLKVLDRITFNENAKIVSVDAYRQF